ncbi:hypothetical protein [Deinococcus sp. Marseille-Q6407]|uniref:hypothetical protein n=1 Tax=Deinococcus sp. Marseille-Q6407 TaxID=2969223 RepID=UPI0021C094DA|nr:hypothetical protein [Deinococcus sp. Marseille-Q6407]
MPSPAPPPPPLPLPRLAAAQPDSWVTLPESQLPFSQSVLRLTQRLPGQRAGAAGEWLLCLSGEAVVDLPQGQWVQLRAGETLRLPAAAGWQALPVAGEVVLLRTVPLAAAPLDAASFGAGPL